MTTATYIPGMETIAHRVRWARERVGLSQREAAMRCGLTFGEWQSLENGADARGLPRKLKAISEGLRNEFGQPIDLEWLTYGPSSVNAPFLPLAHTA